MTIIMIAINLLSPERQLLMCSISASSRRIKGPCNAGALFNSKSVLDLVYGSCAAIGFDSIFFHCVYQCGVNFKMNILYIVFFLMISKGL